MKKCFKCGVEKPLSEYYKHAQMGDGHLNKCKDCTMRDSKENFHKKIQDPAFREKERKRAREKYHRLYEGVYKTNNSTRKKYFSSYPEIKKAHYAVMKMRVGSESHKHHWSYNEEHFRDVFVLRVADHYLIHRHLLYDPEVKKFRSLDGVLLGTREEHESFINKILHQELVSV